MVSRKQYTWQQLGYTTYTGDLPAYLIDIIKYMTSLENEAKEDYEKKRKKKPTSLGGRRGRR